MTPMRALIAVVAMSFGMAAWAQRAQDPSRRVTVMDLEGDVIEGTGDRPDVERVDAAPEDRHHESLIRIRQDFRARAMQSVSAL